MIIYKKIQESPDLCYLILHYPALTLLPHIQFINRIEQINLSILLCCFYDINKLKVICISYLTVVAAHDLKS